MAMNLRWMGLVFGMMFGSAVLCYKAKATMYNFHFNNTEQGDNSTTTPTVIVNGQKGKDIKELKNLGQQQAKAEAEDEDKKINTDNETKNDLTSQ